jgi:hypothetical protein
MQAQALKVHGLFGLQCSSPSISPDTIKRRGGSRLLICFPPVKDLRPRRNPISRFKRSFSYLFQIAFQTTARGKKIDSQGGFTYHRFSLSTRSIHLGLYPQPHQQIPGILFKGGGI